jgi:hypothetical protein
VAQAVSLSPLIVTICIFFLGIYKYTNTFSLVGGVNLPKKVGCVGTDGIERPQLVKVKYLHTVTCTRESLCFLQTGSFTRYVLTSVSSSELSAVIRMIFVFLFELFEFFSV